MPFFARVVLGVGSLETIIDSKCSILFIPTSKGVATQINGDFKKIYLREEGVLEDEWEKFRKKYEDEELARSYWPSCRTRGIPGLDSATFPHLVPCKFTFYRRYYKTDWHLLDHVITP